MLARAEVACGSTFQAAAWAHRLADRTPARVEVAAATPQDARRLPDGLDVSVFATRLGYVTANGVPALRPASVLAHMAASPSRVRSWTSAAEWLPDVATDASAAGVLAELQGRPATVAARLGYLPQGLMPDIAGQIAGPQTKTWFGPRRPLVRHDNRWQVADTLLPSDPRDLEAVT